MSEQQRRSESKVLLTFPTLEKMKNTKAPIPASKKMYTKILHEKLERILGVVVNK